MQTVEDLQSRASPERYAAAPADAKHLFTRFSGALGTPLDRGRLPATIRLLYGALGASAAIALS